MQGEGAGGGEESEDSQVKIANTKHSFVSEASVRPLHMDVHTDDSIYPAAGARGKPIITLGVTTLLCIQVQGEGGGRPLLRAD